MLNVNITNCIYKMSLPNHANYSLSLSLPLTHTLFFAISVPLLQNATYSSTVICSTLNLELSCSFVLHFFCVKVKILFSSIPFVCYFQYCVFWCFVHQKKNTKRTVNKSISKFDIEEVYTCFVLSCGNQHKLNVCNS